MSRSALPRVTVPAIVSALPAGSSPADLHALTLAQVASLGPEPPIATPESALRAWSSLQFVFGSGLPASLRRAQAAGAAVRGGRR